MKNLKRFGTLLLTVAVAYTILVTGFAAGEDTAFTDVQAGS